MLTDFSTEYSHRSDDELLHLATQRHYLTEEARAALDTELRRRNLTESDRVEHQKFEKQQERREFRHPRRRKLFGKRQFSGRELLSSFAAIAVIVCVYFVLPKQYRLKPDWAEAAFCVMMPSVFVIVGWRSLWRDIAFWIAVILSASIQLVVAHAWLQQAGGLKNRNAGKLVALLGFVLFIAIYGGFKLLRRNFYGERTSESG